MTMQKQFINVVALGLALLSLASCGSNNKFQKVKQNNDSPPPGGSATVALVSATENTKESAPTCDTIENVSTDSEPPRGGQDTTEAKNKAEAEAYLQKLWKTIPSCVHKMRQNRNEKFTLESERKFSKKCSDIVKYFPNELPGLVQALYPATGGNKESTRRFLKLVIILGNVDGKTTMVKEKVRVNGIKSTTVQKFMDEHFKLEKDIAKDIAYWKESLDIDVVKDKSNTHWGYSLAPAS